MSGFQSYFSFIRNDEKEADMIVNRARLMTEDREYVDSLGSVVRRAFVGVRADSVYTEFVVTPALYLPKELS